MYKIAELEEKAQGEEYHTPEKGEVSNEVKYTEENLKTYYNERQIYDRVFLNEEAHLQALQSLKNKQP